MSYQIVTGSACNLTEETIDAFGLEILPLTFMVDGVQHRSYLKGEKTDLRQFYTMMREGKVITTSLPN
ncbi:MAG: DegV family protein, partial [Slackia isoflavoniconvertens]|nr:DegV family protein [Slackia isoflavoniconvertens]